MTEYHQKLPPTIIFLNTLSHFQTAMSYLRSTSLLCFFYQIKNEVKLRGLNNPVK